MAKKTNIPQKAFWSFLLNDIDELVLLVSEDFRVLEYNNAALKFFNPFVNVQQSKSFFELCSICGMRAPPLTEALKKQTSMYFTTEFIYPNTEISAKGSMAWTLFKHESFSFRKKRSHILIIGRDITHNKKNQFYEEQHIVLENILKYIPVSVYWKDLEGKYLGCSEYTVEMAGLESREQMLGRHDSDLPWKAVVDQIRSNDEKAIVQDEPVILEEYAEFRGAEHSYLAHKVPLRDAHNVCIGVLGVSIDVSTAQKKAEQALRKAKELAEAASEAKTHFIANMSHDIRTPLSGIKYISDILLEQDAESPDKIREHAKMLKSATDSLLELFESILDMTKAESLETNTFHKFNLVETTQKVVDMMKPTAVAKQVNIKVNIASNLPTYLVGNELYIHRILLNLIGNALKFTAEGMVTISVSMQAMDSEKVIIVLEVEDTGIGIPEEKRSTIFDRFSRVEPAYKNNAPGVGLGLYIVKQYIEEMQGEIYLDSEVGKGTKFTCVVPMKISLLSHLSEKVDQSQQHKKQALSTESAQQGVEPRHIDGVTSNRYNVLLVEDIPIIQHTVGIVLQQAGCCVTFVDSGEDAVSAVKDNPDAYDLVVMDIGLPGIDGYEATKQIRAIEKQCNKKPLPIIGHTAHFMEKVQTAAAEAGMTELFKKPLAPDAAHAMLEKYIMHKQPDQHLPSQTLEDRELDGKDQANHKIIDIELGKRTLRTQEAVESFLKDVVSSLPKDKQFIDDAYQQQDWDALRRASHRLHGVLCYTCLPPLKEAVKRIEVTVAENNLDAVPTAYDEFVHQYDQFFTEYEKHYAEK